MRISSRRAKGIVVSSGFMVDGGSGLRADPKLEIVKSAPGRHTAAVGETLRRHPGLLDKGPARPRRRRVYVCRV